MTDDWEVVQRLTVAEAEEIVSAAQALLEATKDEIRAEYEWDVDFHAVRINSKWARIGFRRALEPFNREGVTG